MADSPEAIVRIPELGIRPKGVPPTDHVGYLDLVAQGKLNPLGFFNVRAFGATGDANVDVSKAIQRAVDAAGKAGGGTVYFPQGTYLTGTTVQLPTAAISLVGAGLASVIKGDADPLILSSTDPVNSKLVVRDLKIELTKTSAQKGLNVTQTWTADPKASLMLDNVWFMCDGHVDSVELFIQGVREGSISNCWFESTTGDATGIEMKDRAMNLSVHGCQFITLERGIYMWRSSGSVTVEGIRIADCLFIGGNDAIKAVSVLSLQVIGCMIDSIQGIPLNLSSPNWHTIIGNWLASSGSGKPIIYIAGPSLPSKIIGNYFGGGGDGIRVEASSGAVRQFSILGNTFGVSDVGVNFGLSGGFIDRMKIEGNDFNGCDIGVHLGTATPRDNNIVTGNTFLNIATADIAGGGSGNITDHNIAS